MKKRSCLSIAIQASYEANEPPKGTVSMVPALGQGFDSLAYASLAMAPSCSYADFLALKYQQSEKSHHRIITPLAISASHNDARIDTNIASVIAEDEHRAIIASLKDFLASDDDSISLCDDGSYLWSTNKDPAICSMPLRDIDSKSFYAILNDHRDRINWHPLFTELQMLLHQHPVNLARRARSLPEVSGVWIWGEGGGIDQQREGIILSDDPQNRLWADALGMAFILCDSRAIDWPGITQQHSNIVVMMSHADDQTLQELMHLAKKYQSHWHWTNISYRGKVPPWWRKILR